MIIRTKNIDVVFNLRHVNLLLIVIRPNAIMIQ